MRKIPPLLIMDAFRGFAALWVTMFHGSMQFIDGGHLEFFKNPLYAFSCYGTLGVPMFFVISGYCITGAAYESIRSSSGIMRFASARVRRIYPPYLVVLALTLLMGIVAAFFDKSLGRLPHNINLSDPIFWISNITLTHEAFKLPICVGVSWSLSYEVTFYAIVGSFVVCSNLFSRGNTKSGIKILSKLTFLLTFLSVTWLILSPKTCPFPLDKWYQFGIGSMLFLHKSSEEEANEKRRCMPSLEFILIGVLTLAFGVIYQLSRTPHGMVEGYVLAHPHATSREEAFLCISTAALLGFMWPRDHSLVRSRLIQILMWLGTISYSLYLTQMLLIPFIIARLRLMGLDGSYYWITFLIVLTATIVCGWIFNRLVESRFISFMNKQRVDEEKKLLNNALL